MDERGLASPGLGAMTKGSLALQTLELLMFKMQGGLWPASRWLSLQTPTCSWVPGEFSALSSSGLMELSGGWGESVCPPEWVVLQVCGCQCMDIPPVGLFVCRRLHYCRWVCQAPV